MLFADRFEAGRFLASRLADLRNRDDVVVLALPRGGVPVGYEVAKELHAPLDIFVVRKLGVPGHEELAMGALASGGITLLNPEIIEGLGISREAIDAVIAREQRELERREREYRDGSPPLDVANRIAVLVDDGLATGSSMRVAATALRKKSPELQPQWTRYVRAAKSKFEHIAVAPHPVGGNGGSHPEPVPHTGLRLGHAQTG
jgi:predicted phosphoribosyltransferase